MMLTNNGGSVKRIQGKNRIVHCGFIDGSNDNLPLSYVKSIQLHLTKNFKKVFCDVRSKFLLLT